MPDELPVSPEVRIYGDERRNQELALWLQRIYLLLEEIREEPDVPIVNVAPTDLSGLEGLLTREPFDPEAIANALARRLPQDKTPEVAEALSEVTKQLQRLNKKVTGLSTMPSGGSSGHVIVDSGIITSITQPVEIANDLGNPVPVSGSLAVTNFPASTEIANDSGNPIPVNGTVNVGNFPASVEVANDAGNPLPVSGTFWPATQPVSGSVNVVQGSYYRTDTFTAVANGATVDVTANPPTAYSIQVKGTGAAPTAWDVRLEGSLDGTNFTQILQHTTTTGDGVVLFSGTARSPARYIRARAAGLTLGLATDIVVSILGVRSA